MKGRITVEKLNVRGLLNSKGPKVDIHTLNTPVDILDQRSEWLEIRSGEGSAFVRGGYSVGKIVPTLRKSPGAEAKDWADASEILTLS